MTGYERIATALAGRKPDRVPVMLHNFMHAAREAGFTQAQYRWSAERIVEAHLRAVETYGLDGILLDIDTATLADAVGVPVSFPEREPARTTTGCLHLLEDIHDWPMPDLRNHPRVDIWLEAAERLVEKCGRDIYVRGHCDQAPFSLAGMIRGPERWMVDLLTEGQEPHCQALLDYCSAVTCRFVKLMTHTHVPMVSNTDSSAGPGVIPPDMYRRWAMPYERRVVQAAHEVGCQYVLHICGPIEPILGDMLRTGADGFDLDHRTAAAAARDALAGAATLLGNIDPSGVLALGSEADVARATRELLEVFAGVPRFILGAGSALSEDTPEENIRAMVRAAREFAG